MLKEELRENVFSRWFLAAFLVMLLTLLSMSLPERIVSRGDEEQYRMSALQLAILPIYFGGVMLLFPFCACTAAAPQQTIEIRTGFAKWKIMRGGLNAYLRRKAIAGFVSGGLSVMLAFVAHAVIWALIAMPSQPELYGTHEIPYRPDTIYYPLVGIAHGWPVLLWKAGGIFVMGGVWATVGMAVAWWLADPLLAVSLPTFLYYLWNSPASGLLGYRLPSASRLYNDQLTWGIAAEALGVNLVFLALVLLTCRAALKRRALHDA